MVAGVGLAGCLGGAPAEPPTATETEAEPGTPTQATGLGTIEYTVVNEDDRTHSLAVSMANAEGRVVQETFEPEFDPGGSVASGSAGHPPDAGPYELTFEVETDAATHVWDVTECGRVHLQVTVTGDGTITIGRDLCQN